MVEKGLRVRDVLFGTGMPRVCVPIIAKNKEDIIESAQMIYGYRPDCIEWRMDWFEQVDSPDAVSDVLQGLRETVGDTVLLATFRTKQEGGEKDIPVDDYRHLSRQVCESGLADMIDIEGFMQEGLLSEMCGYAHDRGVFVVGSNHDFFATPKEPEIVRRLELMDKAGADLPKIAVMPQSERDVLSLLSATLRYRENGGVKPIITMSMADLGMVSRLAGGIFGSAMTFAAVNQTSAPGQIPIEELKKILPVIYKYDT